MISALEKFSYEKNTFITYHILWSNLCREVCKHGHYYFCWAINTATSWDKPNWYEQYCWEHEFAWFIHFLYPLLAHALGIFVGVYLVARFAPQFKFVLALFVSGLFLLGGIMMVMMLPSPMWFNTLDLGVAYIPMGYLGWWLNQPKI